MASSNIKQAKFLVQISTQNSTSSFEISYKFLQEARMRRIVETTEKNCTWEFSVLTFGPSLH